VKLVSTFEEVNPIIAQAAKEPARVSWLDDLEKRFQDLEERLKGMTRTTSSMVAAVESASSVDPEEVEKTVNRLMELEEGLGTDLSRFRAEQDHWVDLLRHHTRKAQRRFSELLGHLEEAMIRTAEALRDARWQLLAIQAQIEEEGEGPIFDDPEALERYLGSG